MHDGAVLQAIDAAPYDSTDWSCQIMPLAELSAKQLGTLGKTAKPQADSPVHALVKVTSYMYCKK